MKKNVFGTHWPPRGKKNKYVCSGWIRPLWTVLVKDEQRFGFLKKSTSGFSLDWYLFWYFHFDIINIAQYVYVLSLAKLILVCV
jgi:hypothetical protein